MVIVIFTIYVSAICMICLYKKTKNQNDAAKISGDIAYKKSLESNS